MFCNYSKVLKINRQLNFVNVSYLFIHTSYLEKTYTTTAPEPSIYAFVVSNKLGTSLISQLNVLQFIIFKIKFDSDPSNTVFLGNYSNNIQYTFLENCTLTQSCVEKKEVVFNMKQNTRQLIFHSE